MSGVTSADAAAGIEAEMEQLEMAEMEGWAEVARVYHSGTLTPITALAFDPHHEAVWGRIVSLMMDGSGYSYTRFRAHETSIRGLLAHDLGVFSLSYDSLRATSRQGIDFWSWQNDPVVRDLCTMSMGVNKEILVGGDRSVYAIHSEYGNLIRKVDVEDSVVLLKQGKLLACATMSGRLLLKDPRSLRTEHSLAAHSGIMVDLDIGEHVVATCGSFASRAGQEMPDPTVKLFDLRKMQLLTSFTVSSGAPRFLKLSPNRMDTLAIMSRTGALQFEDIHQHKELEFFQLDTGGQYFGAMDWSLSGDMMVFGDSTGCVHQWISKIDATVNPVSHPLELASPEVPPEVSLEDPETPLNMIGMPYYDEPLLSSLWPSNKTVCMMGHPPTTIDPEILAHVKTIDFVGYAPNLLHGKRRRYQAASDKSRQRGGKSGTRSTTRSVMPRFRSEQERDQRLQKQSVVQQSPSIISPTEALPSQVASAAGFPDYYRQVEIKYSRFGVEDFDFGFYNRTQYGGLETHIANSYCNSLLQSMFFTVCPNVSMLIFQEPLRRSIQWHMTLECSKEFCLCCELGFLFRMLEDAKGMNCQASNFLRSFATIPQVSALGLIEPDTPALDTPYVQLIQNFNRFILEYLNQEIAMPSNPVLVEAAHVTEQMPIVQQLFGMQVKTISRCQCQYETSRTTWPYSIDLTYPKKSTASPSKLDHAKSFSEVLQSSFLRENQTKGWCKKCSAYTPITQMRRLNNLPPILSVNCAAISEDDLKVWRSKDQYFRFDEPDFYRSPESTQLRPFNPFLPLRIEISLNGGPDGTELVVREFEPTDVPSADADKATEQTAIYELTSIVCHIENGQDPTHLVAFVRTPAEDKLDGPDRHPYAKYRWYLINDFLIRSVTVQEAAQFRSPWKIPAIIQYQRMDVDGVINRRASALPQRLSRNLITKMAVIHKFHHRTKSLSANYISPLSLNEMQPGNRFLAAIDAEFVALSHEETEVRSDGTRSLIRPVRMHLARVSVLRGDGTMEGVPFIDDYIGTSEPIVDYLTEYSGIYPEDLDPDRARHPVIPLKTAYKKLRLLLDSGCVFIGHGLKKDFRTINILVPPEQVIDTVDIYRLEGQRKISLRYLAWWVLKHDIQSDTHDSIEDARTALMLYKRYVELQKAGMFQQLLETMYDEGRKLNWRAPHWQSNNRDTQMPGSQSLLGEYGNSPSMQMMGSPSTPPLVPLPPILAPAQWPQIGNNMPEYPPDVIETTLLSSAPPSHNSAGGPRFADIAAPESAGPSGYSVARPPWGAHPFMPQQEDAPPKNNRRK